MKTAILDSLPSIQAERRGWRDSARILSACVGPYDRYCASAGVASAAGYIAAPLIGLGLADLSCSHPGSRLLDGILAFDRAESSTANLTQTNLIAVSSFCGINGLVWGYDLAKQPLRRHPLLAGKEHPQAYDLTPLLEATQALLGTVREPRFPVAPGEHLVCAYKSHTVLGPCRLYGAMALAVAAERDRHADLFMEDHGTLADEDEEALVLGNLLRSVAGIGENLGVHYEKVFVGLRSCWVAEGRVGCALTAAPYLHLARLAAPSTAPEALAGMTLSQWERSVLPFETHYG